jgi:hypothetical protein
VACCRMLRLSLLYSEYSHMLAQKLVPADDRKCDNVKAGQACRTLQMENAKYSD